MKRTSNCTLSIVHNGFRKRIALSVARVEYTVQYFQTFIWKIAKLEIMVWKKLFAHELLK